MSDNPVQKLLEKAVNSYGDHLDERTQFELSACIFSMVMIKLGRKAEQENCSLMIVLVLSIWESMAHGMFLNKEQCATVLMDRVSLFKKVGEQNRVKQLSGSLVVANSYKIPQSFSQEGRKYSFGEPDCDTSEAWAADWIESVAPLVDKLVNLSDSMDAPQRKAGVLSLVHRESHPVMTVVTFVVLLVVLILLLVLRSKG